MRCILLADDHPAIHLAMNAIVSEFLPNFTVKTFNDFYEIRNFIYSERIPRICILDVGMPGFRGLRSILEIKELCPSCRVIILSQDRSEFFAQFYLENGVDAYIDKRAKPVEIKNAILKVFNGHSGFVEGPLSLDGIDLINTVGHQLSGRERIIHNLLIRNMSAKTIATKLNLSLSTVGTYKRRIFAKLGVTNEAEYYRNYLPDDI